MLNIHRQKAKNSIAYRDIPYVTDGYARQMLDLYLPKKGENFPLIIWIHGGAFFAGDKSDYAPVEYIDEGYAVASLNYRLSQHGKFPAQIEDCKSAVRWLRANAEKYRINPNKFGAWGASAGGYLVTMIGVTGNIREFDVGENLSFPSDVKAVVNFFGPTDFLQMDNHRLPDGMIHNAPDSPESLLTGEIFRKIKIR